MPGGGANGRPCAQPGVAVARLNWADLTDATFWRPFYPAGAVPQQALRSVQQELRYDVATSMDWGALGELLEGEAQARGLRGADRERSGGGQGADREWKGSGQGVGKERTGSGMGANAMRKGRGCGADAERIIWLMTACLSTGPLAHQSPG